MEWVWCIVPPDTQLQRTVAIKVLLLPSLAHDRQFRVRFDREAQTIAAEPSAHLHMCTLYDIGQDQSIAYLVLKTLEPCPYPLTNAKEGRTRGDGSFRLNFALPQSGGRKCDPISRSFRAWQCFSPPP